MTNSSKFTGTRSSKDKRQPFNSLSQHHHTHEDVHGYGHEVLLAVVSQHLKTAFQMNSVRKEGVCNASSSYICFHYVQLFFT